ncbi:hypothetical protein [Breoghania sp.]|uniref:hypothetical protein n=1 Tax=Breoghania sp. TaxID=2065378 RepID=UPI0026308B46|nr:hypothetical protein [Breoghania sp.]MDJ0930333.1 hypothetical protein [Breoghania sp.]
MTGTALIIAGDLDLNLAFSTRLSYRWDAYSKSPAGNKILLTFIGAKHIFGDISGYDFSETMDENPALVQAVRSHICARSSTRATLHGVTPWRLWQGMMPRLRRSRAAKITLKCSPDLDRPGLEFAGG